MTFWGEERVEKEGEGLRVVKVVGDIIIVHYIYIHTRTYTNTHTHA